MIANPSIEKIRKYLKVLILITSIVGVASIVIEYGFKVSGYFSIIIHYVSITVIFLFIFYNILQFLLADRKRQYLKAHIVEVIMILLIVFEGLLSVLGFSMVRVIGLALKFDNIAYLYVVFAQIFIVIGIIVGGLRYNTKILQTKLHPSRVFVLSFFTTIMVGALALMLPAASFRGGIKFIDALFTSTSAVCVTGLTTLDTATEFTRFGQIVIMMLFQIGGLGLMTFTTFFALFLSGGLGIKERILLHDLLDEENIGAITQVLASLTIITITVELIGAAVLYLSIYKIHPDPYEAVFISLFHSISAFCNAGFSIFTKNLMDPLVRDNYIFTTTVSFLIIIGGIGFPTIMSILKFSRFKKVPLSLEPRMSLQTKMVLRTTIILILIGTVVTFFLESGNTLNGLNLFEKIHASYFQSVTSRTAGFNTLDFAQFSIASSFFYLFLMYIGASPGGTGGGIKTTTLVLLVVGLFAILRNEKNIVIGKRTIPKEIVLRAFVKSITTVFIISVGIMILTITEKTNLMDISFEAFSAFGTVGLSRGLTPVLTDAGKLIITLLMFIGRVGPLAFIYSLMRAKEQANYDLPSENISIL